MFFLAIRRLRFCVICIFWVAFGFSLYATEFAITPEHCPLIQKLSSRDVVFSQFLKTVEYNDKIAADAFSKNEQEVEFYTVVLQNYEDLLSVAAASGIPYDTIATLNGITSGSEKIGGKKIILPTVKGLFAAKNPVSSVEFLISKEFAQDIEKNTNVCYNLNNRELYFLSGKRFTSTQRAFFLDSSIQMPLDKILVSSGFGYRTSPVYGKWKFHKGIDFASPEGSSVYACKGGTVSVCVKNDSVFGNYVIISHNDGRTSVYAHLSKLLVRKGEVVHGGAVIGLVGQTGMATGPHLHFEIRQNGIASDPADFLRL